MDFYISFFSPEIRKASLYWVRLSQVGCCFPVDRCEQWASSNRIVKVMKNFKFFHFSSYSKIF